MKHATKPREFTLIFTVRHLEAKDSFPHSRDICLDEVEAKDKIGYLTKVNREAAFDVVSYEVIEKSHADALEQEIKSLREYLEIKEKFLRGVIDRVKELEMNLLAAHNAHKASDDANASLTRKLERAVEQRNTAIKDDNSLRGNGVDAMRKYIATLDAELNGDK